MEIPLSPLLLAAIPLGIAIGLAVGTVGGGGAVLAVPVLVFVVGMEVHEAITVSLAVVAAAAVVGATGQARRGTVCWSSAGWFAAAAAAGSAAGAAASRLIGGDVLLVGFSVVMAVASVATWQRSDQPAGAPRGCPHARAGVLVPTGLVTGAVTGLVGVGGGFLIVPALAIGLSFGLREAMATSMVVVAIVSVFALLAHLAAGSAFDAEAAAVLGAATVTGALIAPRLSDHIPDRLLGRGFAALIALVATGVLTATLA